MDNLSHKAELIEKYILGEMSGDELRSFENEMQGNADLKEEVYFQKDIVAALKMERRAALKARMDNVKIPSPYASYYTAGIASVVLIGGIALLTTLWPVEFNDELPVVEEKTEILENEIEPVEVPEIENLTEESEISESNDNSRSQASEISKNVSDEQEPETITTKRKTFESPQPKVVVPNAPEPNAEGGITTSKLDAGNEKILNNDKRETSKVEVEIKSSKSYNFHYQYFNNKLFLYGDFSKSPYELIELNSEQSKNLYMYFGGKYYSLNSNQMEVSKLNPLRDKIIIKGLDNLRLL